METKQITFLELYRQFIAYHTSTNNPFYKRDKGTLSHYNTRYMAINEYLQKRGLVRIPASSFTIELAEDMLDYFCDLYSYNHAVRVTEMCKMVNAYGARKGIITINHLAGLKIKRDRTVKITFLTSAELQAIIDLQGLAGRREKARDMFVFQCLTGMDYGDMITVGRQNIAEYRGYKFIIKERHKTKNAANIPYISGNIQGVQVKKFDKTNHTEKFKGQDGEKKAKQNTLHRIIAKECDKAKIEYPDWLVKYLNFQDRGGKIFNCFFGEHLLNEDKTKTLAVVEAPKTAIVASVYFPQFIWLAVGALDYLTFDRCKVLKGRNVVLFPDLNCFDRWSARAEQLKNIAKIKVFDFLEQSATDAEKAKDLDLCDYLLQYDYLDFTQPARISPSQQERGEILKREDNRHSTNDKKGLVEIGITPKQSSTFKQIASDSFYIINTCEPFDIEQIENDLRSIVIPDYPVWINTEALIEDCPRFVASHLESIKKNNGNRTFLPHYQRLKNFIEIIKKAELATV